MKKNQIKVRSGDFESPWLDVDSLDLEHRTVTVKYPVQVRFLGGGFGYSIYVYNDPTGEVEVGDTVTAGFRNALAVVVALGSNHFAAQGLGDVEKVSVVPE